MAKAGHKARQKCSSANPAKTVTVLIDSDNLVLLDPLIPAVADLLTYEQVTYTSGGPTGFKPAKETFTLYDSPIRSGRLVFSAGLWPRVHQFLKEDGYRVQVEDHRKFGPRQVENKAAFDATSAEERSLLEVIARTYHGQIEVSNFATVVDWIALLVRFYPEARFVIAVATKGEGYRLAKALRGALDEPFSLALGGPSRRPVRIILGLTLKLVPDRVEWLDFLLLPDPERCLGDIAVKDLVRIPSLRVFAFVAPGRPRGERARLRLEALAGPVIYTSRPRTAAVEVIIVPSPRPIPIWGDTALERRRRGCWENERRNSLIAHVARAYATQNSAALCHFGLLPDEKAALPEGDVAIVVETLEHARFLLRYLPDWPIYHAKPDCDDEDGETAGSRPGQGAIITVVCAAREGIDAGILIRATGGTGTVALARFCPPRQKDGRSALLIDFDDSHDPQAADETRRRVSDYLARNWKVHHA
jgi:hypothetical protein